MQAWVLSYIPITKVIFEHKSVHLKILCLGEQSRGVPGAQRQTILVKLWAPRMLIDPVSKKFLRNGAKWYVLDPAMISELHKKVQKPEYPYIDAFCAWVCMPPTQRHFRKIFLHFYVSLFHIHIHLHIYIEIFIYLYICIYIYINIENKFIHLPLQISIIIDLHFILIFSTSLHVAIYVIFSI